MKFFYASGAMGFSGEGYFWHSWFNFPKYPIVTKTFTKHKKTGCPICVIPLFKSVWNYYALHNPGLDSMQRYNAESRNHVISIHGSDDEILETVKELNEYNQASGIELNYSCPNVKSPRNKTVPKSEMPLYLKLNHKQDPYSYNLDYISGIRLNSVPLKFGAISGKLAQKQNWSWIKQHKDLMKKIPIAGCSWTNIEDIYRLQDMGCKEFSIGSVIITNPRFVKDLPILFPD